MMKVSRQLVMEQMIFMIESRKSDGKRRSDDYQHFYAPASKDRGGGGGGGEGGGGRRAYCFTVVHPSVCLSAQT